MVHIVIPKCNNGVVSVRAPEHYDIRAQYSKAALPLTFRCVVVSLVHLSTHYSTHSSSSERALEV